MTPEERNLRAAEREFRNATAKAEEKRTKRNAALMAALASGLTHAKAAAITNLSRGRIGQLSPGKADDHHG